MAYSRSAGVHPWGRDALKPIFKAPRQPFLHPQQRGAALPLLGIDAIGGGAVFDKHGIHLARKIRPKNHGVQFVVVQETPPVQIG